MAASDPARQPAPTCAAQPPAEHEPGLSPSYRVASYGSALEVWALLVRLSHCQRARSELIRWLSVVIRAAAAKHCFMLCSTEHRSQTRNLSIFHETWKTGTTDKPLPSRPQKTSSPLTLASLLAPRLYRCSTGFPHAWLTTFVILRTQRLLFRCCDAT